MTFGDGSPILNAFHRPGFDGSSAPCRVPRRPTLSLFRHVEIDIYEPDGERIGIITLILTTQKRWRREFADRNNLRTVSVGPLVCGVGFSTSPRS